MEKVKKQIDPLVGMIGTLEMMKEAAVTGEKSWRREALQTDLVTHTIDTCPMLDTGIWETGVKPRGLAWIIVEQYDDSDAARIGHARWVTVLTQNPNLELEDIHVWTIV